MKIQEINVTTQEETVREATPEELAQYNLDLSKAAEADKNAKAAKDAAVAKLDALGLTVDDLKALGLGNN
jgi:hypothetical protein